MDVLYVPRSQLLAQIKKTRRKDIKAAFTEQFRGELKVVEYLTICCTFQMNLYYILIFMELAITHGAILVTILYCVLTAVMGMPLFMLFTFMSTYSKQSYISFWKCIPLFEGLGYSFALLRLMSELRNVRMSSFALLLVLKFSTGDMAQGISKCTKNQSYCITMYPTTVWNTTLNCSLESEYVETSFRNYIYNIGHEFNVLHDRRLFSVPWLITSSTAWMYITICSMLGMRYIRRITVVLQLVCVCTMIFICVYCLYKISWATISNATLIDWIENKSAFQFHFWIDLILHASSINVLGNMIWLGSLMPSNFHPTYAAVIISPLKLLGFLLFLSIGTCLVKENLVHYKIMNGRCLKFRPRDILFVMIPDVLFRTTARNVFIPLWYVCVAYAAACPPIYTIIGLMNSLHQRYSFLGEYQMYLIIAICVLSFCCSTFLLGTYELGLFGPWRRCVMPLWTSILLLLVSLGIFFIYSTRAIVEDYLFMYGYTPEKFWITSWKTIPILAGLCFILVGYNQYTNPVCITDVDVILLAHLLTISALLSILIVFFYTCLKYMKAGTLNALATPSVDWGPHNLHKKMEKTSFFPHRNIRYRSTSLKCKHNCLAKYNHSFWKLVLTHRHRLTALEHQLETARTNNEDSSSED